MKKIGIAAALFAVSGAGTFIKTYNVGFPIVAYFSYEEVEYRLHKQDHHKKCQHLLN